MIRHLTIPMENFDPLSVYTHLYPEGPGFLETLNPLPKTGRYSIVPLRVAERYVLAGGKLFASLKTCTANYQGIPSVSWKISWRPNSNKSLHPPSPADFLVISVTTWRPLSNAYHNRRVAICQLPIWISTGSMLLLFTIIISET